MQEILPAPPHVVNHQQYAHFAQSDASAPQPYASLSPHDTTLPPDPSAQMHATMFSQTIDPSTAAAMSMHMALDPISAAPDSTAAPMDVSVPQLQNGSPGIIPDLPSQPVVYGIDPRIATLEAMESSHSLLSSPSAHSSSTGASHASSPALAGVAPSYTTGSSSLAFALDSDGATRSRPGSAASPGTSTALGSDLGFPSASSAPPTASHGSGFDFPPSGFENSMQSANDDTPPGGAHLLVLGDLLKKYVRSLVQ